MKRSFTIAIAGLCVLAGVALADEPARPQAKPSALDQQLLDGLDRELLPGIPGGNKPASPTGKPAADKAQSDNPLVLIAERMRLVEARLAQQDTSQETQDAQKQILAQLAQLLERARQQQANGQNKPGNSGKGSNQAGTGSGNPVPA